MKHKAVAKLELTLELVALKYALLLQENIQAAPVLGDSAVFPMVISLTKGKSNFFEVMGAEAIRRYFNYFPLQDIFGSDMFLVADKVIHIMNYSHGYLVSKGLLLGYQDQVDIPNLKRGGIFR